MSICENQTTSGVTNTPRVRRNPVSIVYLLSHAVGEDPPSRYIQPGGRSHSWFEAGVVMSSYTRTRWRLLWAMAWDYASIEGPLRRTRPRIVLDKYWPATESADLELRPISSSSWPILLLLDAQSEPQWSSGLRQHNTYDFHLRQSRWLSLRVCPFQQRYDAGSSEKKNVHLQKLPVITLVTKHDCVKVPLQLCSLVMSLRMIRSTALKRSRQLLVGFLPGRLVK